MVSRILQICVEKKEYILYDVSCMKKLVNDGLGLAVGYLFSAPDLVPLSVYHLFILKLLSSTCSACLASPKCNAFWGVMPCSLLDRFQLFREIYCLQNNSITVLIKRVLHYTSFWFYMIMYILLLHMQTLLQFHILMLSITVTSVLPHKCVCSGFNTVLYEVFKGYIKVTKRN